MNQISCYSVLALLIVTIVMVKDPTRAVTFLIKLISMTQQIKLKNFVDLFHQLNGGEF